MYDHQIEMLLVQLHLKSGLEGQQLQFEFEGFFNRMNTYKLFETLTPNQVFQIAYESIESNGVYEVKHYSIERLIEAIEPMCDEQEPNLVGQVASVLSEMGDITKNNDVILARFDELQAKQVENMHKQIKSFKHTLFICGGGLAVFFVMIKIFEVIYG